MRLPAFMFAAAFCLSAPAVEAAGFRTVTIPADAAGPSIQGAVWSPCGEPVGEVKFLNITLPATADCPIAGDKLPLVVVVENNCYAYSTPTCSQMPVANVADRAPAFNIPAAIGFGNDIFEVRRLVGQAIDHARSGKSGVAGRFRTVRYGHDGHCLLLAVGR